MARDIVLISTADWDNPFWTNKQHVAVSLERAGYRVLYIESLGLRAPGVNAADIKRIFRRIRRSILGPRQVRETIWVWSPLVLPFQRFYFVRLINKILLTIGLAICLKNIGMKKDIFWTYNPMSNRFFNLRRFQKTIYHCVDDIAAQPNMPAEELAKAERALVETVDICFVTAPHLFDERKQWNSNTHYFGNVADFEHFNSTLSEQTKIPKDLEEFPVPRIGFIGAISNYKVDFDLLTQMAQERPDWSIVMIGQIGEGDPETDISQLRRHKNIHLIGARSYASLPNYLKGFDVAIIPSRINQYTRSMFPMKFFEYLAAGRPVVATNLHALQEYKTVAALAESNEDFIKGVDAALSGEIAPLDSRLDIAREQTYERRTRKMLKLIE